MIVSFVFIRKSVQQVFDNRSSKNIIFQTTVTGSMVHGQWFPLTLFTVRSLLSQPVEGH